MKNKEVYVVTNPEYGWDCVLGVYNEKEDAEYHHLYREDDWDEEGNLKEGAEPNDMVIIHGPLTLD